MSTLELENIKHPDNSGDNIALASNGSITIDRQSTDGTIAEFRKAGTVIGNIGVSGGDNLHIASDDTSDVGIKFNGDGSRITPCNALGADKGSEIDLGEPGNAPFKDLYLSGGIQFDSRSNKLDDYEEGTFSPQILNGWGILNPTYSVNTGHYTKIGNTVLVHFRINLSGGSTNGNPVQIYNLPFTVGTITSNVACGLNGWFASSAGNTSNVFMGLEANGTTHYIYRGTSTSIASITGTDIGTGASMTFSGSYTTA